MKPKFVRKKEGIVFVDNKNKEWSKDNLQDIINAFKYEVKRNSILEYYKKGLDEE